LAALPRRSTPLSRAPACNFASCIWFARRCVTSAATTARRRPAT
jgi:hypothetical protein